MKKTTKFSIAKRLHSFGYAFNGLKILFKEEHNSRIHLAATLLVVTLGFILNINTTEWFAVLLAIALVVSFELVNSAIENIADFICPEIDERIKKTKDLAAGAVLWSSIIAVIIGAIVFIPKLWQLIP